MAKKTAKRVKHVPQRTCVGCRQTLAKRSLIRVVRSPAGLRVDSTGKIPGRGAYLHDRRSCWERGLKGALAHALKIELTNQDRETLVAFMEKLPVDTPEELAREAQEALQTTSERAPEGKPSITVSAGTSTIETDQENYKTLGNAL